MEIAIIFGGVSYEHEISIVSAISLKKVLNYQTKFIFCDKYHEFYLIEDKNMTAKHFSSGLYKKEVKLHLKQGGFFTKNMFGDKKVEFDVALNIIHGADGEDGTLPALLNFFNIPYIGPRVEASVLSFNKLWTKHLAKELKIKTLDYEVISRQNPKIHTSFPFIVKPIRLGSSIGVSVVWDENGLNYALDVAFEFDDTLLIEPFVKDVKEYNLAGCKGNDGFIYSVVEEPQKNELLDFDKKYRDFSRTKKVYKADITDSLEQSMQSCFSRIYDPLFLGSLIRCDFFVIDDEVYLNEINPNPGSLANYLFDDFNEVLKKLIKNLPKNRAIPINYEYINSINSAKGKA